MASPFLTARWSNLALVTYPVAPERLAPHVPPGCELDTRDGSAFVSLVAFDFLDTRVAGVRWPGYVDFPEVNLRFYVKHGRRRGVAFLRELVPLHLIAWMARAIYNEPYYAIPMESAVERRDGSIRVRHRFVAGGHAHSLEVVADAEPAIPPESSVEHFFKEHDHGYGTDRSGRRVEYRVYHPVWRTHRVRAHELDVDFGAVYGAEWAFLGDREPCSVVLAEGSGVGVHPGGRYEAEVT